MSAPRGQVERLVVVEDQSDFRAGIFIGGGLVGVLAFMLLAFAVRAGFVVIP